MKRSDPTTRRDPGLPPAPNEGQMPAVRGDRVSSVAATEPPEERRILSFMGETRRVGRWAVPRLMRVRAFFSEVRIDLRENPIPERFTLDVSAWGSRVTLVVPPRVSVTSDVFALMANSINQADEVPRDGERGPHVHVHGSAVLGEFRVLVRERGQ